MGWNEPPDGNNGKDPWGNKGGKKSNGDGPPDLDEIVRKMQQGLGGIFGKKSSNGSGDGSGAALPTAFIFIALIAWLTFDSFYAIDEQERGVVLRFGEHVADLPPGLSLRFPRPIEKVIKVNVGQLRSITHKASMLTQDENIVNVEVAVQWKIRNPADFLFNLYAPAATLRQVTESAVREVIGKNELDFVLTEGRSEIAQRQEVLRCNPQNLQKKSRQPLMMPSRQERMSRNQSTRQKLIETMLFQRREVRLRVCVKKLAAIRQRLLPKLKVKPVVSSNYLLNTNVHLK